MTLPGYRSNERQPLLWDEPLGNHGHIRAVIGNLAEQLTAEYLNGFRHKTVSTCAYCPDVSRGTPPSEFFESKAAGLSGQTFIYEGRLVKDRAFAALNPLSYVIWHHRAETKQVSTVGELERLVLRMMRKLYVIPFAEVDAICSRRPIEALNSAYGGTDRKVYGSGYRIPLGILPSFVAKTFTNGITSIEREVWKYDPDLNLSS